MAHAAGQRPTTRLNHLKGLDLDPITNAFKSFAAEECAVDSM